MSTNNEQKAAQPTAAAPTGGLPTNLFEGVPDNTFAAAAQPEPAAQATFQAMSVPVQSKQPTSSQPKASGSMQLGKKPAAAQAASVGGGISFARKQDNGQVKSLNAKKIDIDFGGDDFFNSFQPAAAQEPEPLFGGLGQKSTAQSNNAKSNKLQEIDSDPFKLGGAAAQGSSNNLSSMNFGGADDGLSEQ